MTHYNMVLSGGGARGFAHLGVLKALQEKECSFAAISAASSGAFIGALLCDGYSTGEIESICKTNQLTQLNFHFTRGLLSMESVSKILSKHLRSKTFESLEYPLFVAVTDLNDGKQVIIKEGNIIDAVIASASIPILFPTAFINGIPYADGGISGNLPVEPFACSSLKTIGIHVNQFGIYNAADGIIAQLERVIHLGIKSTVIREMEQVDLLIEPEGLASYGLFDTKKITEIIHIGYEFTKSKIHLPETL
jgi:NTE family protein